VPNTNADTSHRTRPRCWLFTFLLAVVVLPLSPLEGRSAEALAVDLELIGPGTNIDDPCFWVDPKDPSSVLVFVTSKDSGLVEVFDLATGELTATIPGFGKANNCAVEGDLLLTTDRSHRHVTVHHLPDRTLVRTLGENLGEPEGIDVLDGPAGQKRVYVTDEVDASVHVYDLASGDLVRTFATGFGAGIEPILADDRHQRIYVSRGENERQRGIGLFSPEGQLIREFGAEDFSSDAEGMAIYACGEGGYLVVADQLRDATEFEVFDRITLEHLGTFTLQGGEGDPTHLTDGIDILQAPLPQFPNGLLAACDGCADDEPEDMDIVSWDRIAEALKLARCPGGEAPD
jgi:3-phytase